MITRKGAQLWVVSTAGTASWEWLRGKVDAGREAPQGRRTAYFEWSADPWADPATRPRGAAACPRLATPWRRI